jgi:hypothetical protein
MGRQSICLIGAMLLLSTAAALPQSGQSTTAGDRPAGVLPEAVLTAPDASGAPVKETTGQGSQPSVVDSNATGKSPAVSKRMGPEMESAGDMRAAPDEE